MKTLIVTYQDRVRFLVTNHPEYRFNKLQQQMPVRIKLFGVTDQLAKDLRLRGQRLGDSEWFRLTSEFEQFLAEIIGG